MARIRATSVTLSSNLGRFEATSFTVDGVRWTCVFYENGLSINVCCTPLKNRESALSASSSPVMEVP